MSIRLISKKKIAFRNPSPTGESDKLLTVEPYKFETLPDWVAKDPMYAWGKADGTIDVADDPDDGKKATGKDTGKDTETAKK
ncbi:hypothetical protein [Megasphaera elsdenii]|jgi:hypothetical protein|uniref:hypothetical protein n=1 Tax=Megasphaera elsdenii TaxID=907 RepID=UPI00204883B7|nr:hypothetical protein [Megasphaera elsdenii]DAL67295.1 MAG TPA: protein of unknown function (DUF4385) [Caudoviricetes sp.]